MRFFWALGTSQRMEPFKPSSSSLTAVCASENTSLRAAFSLKKAFRSVPRHSRISTSVAIEGLVRSRSSSEIKPFDSSHRVGHLLLRQRALKPEPLDLLADFHGEPPCRV